MCVNAVQWNDDCDVQVVVDSGSDASCLPVSWASVGCAGGKDPNTFKDAQGNPITGSQTRMAVLKIGDVSFKERWLLSSVTQPLFSVGKLMKQEWNIVHDHDRVPHLTSPDGQVRLPLYYQRNSLRASGVICNVVACFDTLPEQAVRALEVTDPWLKLSDQFHESVGAQPGHYFPRATRGRV